MKKTLLSSCVLSGMMLFSYSALVSSSLNSLPINGVRLNGVRLNGGGTNGVTADNGFSFDVSAADAMHKIQLPVKVVTLPK